MEITTNSTSTDFMKTPDVEAIINDYNTTPAFYLNQTNSSYELASIPLPGLTYTLFGLTWFFTILGLCGNVLILKFRSKSKGHDVLITALASFDSVALLLVAFTQPCVYRVFGTDIRALTTIGCKLIFGASLSALSGSSSVVMLICIERFLAVWFPLRSRYLMSRQTLLRSVWVCVTPMVLTSFVMTILYCEIKDGICHPNFEGSEYSSVLMRMPNTTVYNTSIGFVLIHPMVILFILTPMTIVKLYKRMAIRRQLTTQEQNIGHFQTSVKLTAVSVAHITLLGLPCAVAIAFGLAGSTIDENTLSGLTLAILLNHSINCLLYNIFDEYFRRKVSGLFGFVKEQESGSVMGISQ